jgi:hypothetical protein
MVFKESIQVSVEDVGGGDRGDGGGGEWRRVGLRFDLATKPVTPASPSPQSEVVDRYPTR